MARQSLEHRSERQGRTLSRQKLVGDMTFRGETRTREVVDRALLRIELAGVGRKCPSIWQEDLHAFDRIQGLMLFGILHWMRKVPSKTLPQQMPEPLRPILSDNWLRSGARNESHHRLDMLNTRKYGLVRRLTLIFAPLSACVTFINSL